MFVNLGNHAFNLAHQTDLLIMYASEYNSNNVVISTGPWSTLVVDRQPFAAEVTRQPYEEWSIEDAFTRDAREPYRDTWRDTTPDCGLDFGACDCERE